MKIFSIEKQVPYPAVDYENFDRDKMFADEAKHQEDVKAYLKQLGFTGKHTGELVKMPVADGQALYMVAEGPGKNFGLVHLTYGDGYHYVGIENFPKAKILKMAEQEKAFAKLFQRGKDWWASQKEGATVHYSNGFNEYVRGVIVRTDKGMAMKPTALVGEWKGRDLPHFDECGEVYLGCHAGDIAEGKTMTPHESNMYESDPSRFKVDPRKLPAIDLTPPPLTAEQTLVATMMRLRRNVEQVLESVDRSAPDQIAETRRALTEAKALLVDAGI